MKLRNILIALAVVLLGIQMIRIDTTTPPLAAGNDLLQIHSAPEDVANVLRAACYDCHSYETRYPWYSNIAPVSWWLGNHIREGREHLNFSTFGTMGADDRRESLKEAAEEIQEGKMPLNSYTWTHADARLSEAQKQLLTSWLKTAGSGGATREEPGEEQE